LLEISLLLQASFLTAGKTMLKKSTFGREFRYLIVTSTNVPFNNI